MNCVDGKRANGHAGQAATDLVRRFGLRLVGVALVSVLAGCQVPDVASDEIGSADLAPAPRCELPSFDGGRKYVVEAWALPDSAFNVGEPLRLQMRSSSPSYMSVFYVSTSCKVTRLLSNHPVQAAEIVDFPIAASGLQMTVKPPAGDEVFHFVATRERLDFLSAGDILGETAGIANLDLAPEQFHERLADARGRINPDDWSAITLRTSVVSH